MGTGFHGYHPVTNKKIDLYVSNYFLRNNNENILVCVPAHNYIDFIFANKYFINILQVFSIKKNCIYNYKYWENYYSNVNIGITINSFQFSNLNYNDAKKKISSFLFKKKLCKN